MDGDSAQSIGICDGYVGYFEVVEGLECFQCGCNYGELLTK